MQRKMLLLFALSSLAWYAAAAVPRVHRSFSSERIGAANALQVSLSVEFDPTMEVPQVWMLAESWPPGWEVSEATWNGEPLNPLRRSGDDASHWLFGAEKTPAVEDGTLQYRLNAPAVFSQSAAMNRVEGVMYVFDSHGYVSGMAELAPDESAQPDTFTLLLGPGWSLLALPFEVDAEGRDTLEALQEGGIVSFANGQMAYQRGALPPAGRPFWFHNQEDVELLCTLTAKVVAETPNALCPAGKIVPHRWNLFGVCGGEAVRLADGVVAWRWHGGKYERCAENAVLEPGEAIWLWVE